MLHVYQKWLSELFSMHGTKFNVGKSMKLYSMEAIWKQEQIGIIKCYVVLKIMVMYCRYYACNIIVTGIWVFMRENPHISSIRKESL